LSESLAFAGCEVTALASGEEEESSGMIKAAKISSWAKINKEVFQQGLL
jgi:hypothetical protein